MSFTIQVGKDERTSEVTTVDYSPDSAAIRSAVSRRRGRYRVRRESAVPQLASPPARSTPTLDFFRKELAATGWVAAVRGGCRGAMAEREAGRQDRKRRARYYISEKQRPIVLSLQRRDDGKTNVEIKVAAVCAGADLEADTGCLRPAEAEARQDLRRHRRRNQHEVHAHVIAEVGTVLAFYRRELAARHWKEETPGRRRHAGGGHAQFHLAGRAGRAQARPQI